MTREAEQDWNLERLEDLKLKLRREGIMAFVFDLDDTLKRTRFHEGRGIYCDAIARLSGVRIDREAFMAEWYGTWKELQAFYGVHPQIHIFISRLMAERYGLDWADEDLQAAFRQMWQLIYETVPEGTPGAEELLDLVRHLDQKTYVVTHATPDWTEFKLSDWPDRFDGIYCVDVRRPKDSQTWGEALDHFGLTPSQVVVIGDNIPADILATHQLGVKHLYRMHNGRVHHVEALPEGVAEIDDLRQVLSLLEASLK